MKGKRILLTVVSVLLLLTGITLIAGGGYLLSLSGSAYYLISGIFLLVSSILLLRKKIAGAVLFYLVYIATIIWTMVESGSDYWGWVPRLSLLTVYGFLLALALPAIQRTPSRKVSFSLAGVFVAIFAVAFAMAFVPTHVFNSKDDFPTQPLVATPTPPQAEQPDSDWTHYGRDAEATRFSPLKQITPENVGQLQRVWTYRTGDLPAPGQINKWAAENTPIKVGDAVYVCSARNNIIKLNAKTGKQIWQHNSGVKYDNIPYTAACKGLTFYTSSQIPAGQACHTRLIVGTLDERLTAVDSETGQSCQNFGEQGQTNLLKGLGYTVPGFVAVTAPVPIINGVIVVNHEVLDGQRRWAPSGVIRGYDAETGQFKWAWDVNNPGDSSEPTAGHEYSRGTPNSWAAMVGDARLGLVYVPTGNSAADYYSKLRSDNENKVSSSIVALEAKTGKVRWVFQTVHKDVWDYDMGSQPTLFDFPGPNGTTIPAMLVPTKRGQTFVLNRETGKPLTAVEERPAPAAVVKEDPRAPTQPWSVGMPRLGLPDLTEQKMWGLTLFDQLACRIKFRKANYSGEFTPPSLDKPWIEYPGYNGGSDWGSVAYNPQNGVMIANWNNTPMYDQLITRKNANKLGLQSIDSPDYKPGGGGAEGNGPMADTPYAIKVSPFYLDSTQMLCNEPPFGMITAIDMHTQKVLWQHPLGSGEKNGPFGLATHLPINVGTPNNGGPIITAGGLIFVAATTDDKIRAFDSRTGKQVWSDTLPAGGQATPMTYSAEGKQYLVIMAGGHHFMRTKVGDYVIAYALPDNH